MVLSEFILRNVISSNIDRRRRRSRKDHNNHDLKIETSGETIKLDIRLRAFVRRETAKRWIAVCPKLDVVTQGTSREDAKRCLDEAVQLWFEDCIERGTLEQALRECGFRTATREEAEVQEEHILLTRDDEPDVLGDPFSIHVTVPAYQADALMANA
jgi:predicted RNase H-like HicB family nuclease